VKAKRFLLGSLVLGLLPLLSACGNLLQAQKPPVEVLAPQNGYYEAHPGEEKTLTVRLAPGAEGAQVYLRLSDPCAQGKANCPGWDTTRYPGVEHTRETFTLSASSPEATFRFTVAQDALPQGPFKWEVVAVDGQGREWTTPVYLRILQPGDTPPLEAINFWRGAAGVNPFPREDLERSFGCWQYRRYAEKNRDNPDPPHSADPSKPFYTPEGDLCARTSSLGGYGFCSTNPQQLVPQSVRVGVAGFIAVPLHRPIWITEFASPRPFWFAQYFERKDWSGVAGGMCLYGGTAMGVDGSQFLAREVLFPTPGSEVPIRGRISEWPNPIEACNATQAPKLPYRSISATWQNPVGLPISVMTSVPFQAVDTEATYARLVRTSDGAEVPVCALGSTQFWNQDSVATNVGIWVLRNYGMLVVVPKDPLDPGQEYEVEVKGLFNGQEKSYRWRFRVATAVLW